MSGAATGAAPGAAVGVEPAPVPRAPLAGSAATRERLLRAALELTAEGGYAAASVGAVAGRAGVAAGTLYRHWPSKGELLVELFREACGRELDAMRAAAHDARDAPAADRVEVVLLTFARRALRAPRLAWALLAEPVDPLVEAERLAYRRAYRELLAGLLREGVEAAELPPQDADLVAAALVGGVGEALVGPIATTPGTRRAAGGAHPPGPPAEEILDGLRSLVRRAIGAG